MHRKARRNQASPPYPPPGVFSSQHSVGPHIPGRSRKAAVLWRLLEAAREALGCPKTEDCSQLLVIALRTGTGYAALVLIRFLARLSISIKWLKHVRTGESTHTHSDPSWSSSVSVRSQGPEPSRVVRLEEALVRCKGSGACSHARLHA